MQTETGHLGTIFESKTISELPQIGAGITGNDWANFNILLPGAAGSPTAPGSEGSGSYNAGDAISINGNLPNYANYLQDGGVVQLPVSNNVDNTLFEAVSEVQVTTSSFSAEYGIGGAVFNQITKSGTNSFHGSAYEYWQNTALNAAPFFGIPNSTGGFTPQKAGYLGTTSMAVRSADRSLRTSCSVFFVVDKIYNNGAAGATLGTTPTLAEIGKGTALLAPSISAHPACPRSTTPRVVQLRVAREPPSSAENTGSLAGVNAIPASASSGGREDSKLLPCAKRRSLPERYPE